MGSKVLVNGEVVSKSGQKTDEVSEIVLKTPDIPYVSRGGLKLEWALKEFSIKVTDKEAIDIGASTGGFTDCLLQQGAKKVYAVDVGYGQLAWKLSTDKRVIVMDRTNIRYLGREKIPRELDISVIDVSFISLKKVIPKALEFLKENGEIVALVKPQFEVGKGEVGKGGVVKEESKREEVINEIGEFAKNLGLTVLGTCESPIKGRKGNAEYLIYLQK